MPRNGHEISPIKASKLRKWLKRDKIFLVTFVVPYNNTRYIINFILWTVRANRNETGHSQKQYFIFHYIFRLLYPTCCVIRDEKPIDEGNVAKSTITGPRIATDKSRYGNRCRAPCDSLFPLCAKVPLDCRQWFNCSYGNTVGTRAVREQSR